MLCAYYDKTCDSSALFDDLAIAADSRINGTYEQYRNRYDVLTLLIHLGYLAYEETTGKACIPNEEIRIEFARVVREVKRDDTIRRVRESDQLIEDTVCGNADAVAVQIEKIHAEEAPLHYNSEQSLRSVIERWRG